MPLGKLGYIGKLGAPAKKRNTPGVLGGSISGFGNISLTPSSYGNIVGSGNLSGTLTVVAGPTPSTPVLAMDPSWVDPNPIFDIDVDNTVATGDVIVLQIQIDGGSWSSLVVNNTHTITSGEDAANQITLPIGALTNGTYDARVNVTHAAATSAWSNIVVFTIAAGGTGGTPIGLLLSLTH